MSIENLLYPGLILLTLSYPLYKSRDTRVNFVKKWPAFFKALPFILTIMIPWDMWFVKSAYWGFNPRYNFGLEILHLPLEEWLFFIIIPFACVFIYEVVVYYDPKNRFQNAGKWVNGGVLVFSLSMAILGNGQMYTFITFFLLSILLALHQFFFKADYLGRFYVSFGFILIPFSVINGILTGAFIPEEVVWYNMDETFGLRIGTIPFEDFFYCLFMILLSITVYQYFLKKTW